IVVQQLGSRCQAGAISKVDFILNEHAVVVVGKGSWDQSLVRHFGDGLIGTPAQAGAERKELSAAKAEAIDGVKVNGIAGFAEGAAGTQLAVDIRLDG